MSPRKALPPEQSEPRLRLLAVATRLFSERGFDAVSTREICTGAQLNIHYHFGDKDGLYREVLRAPVEALNAELRGFDDPALNLHETIQRFLAPFLVADAACGTQLFMREMQQPSEHFMAVVARDVAPHFETFKAVLARHAGVAADDPAIAQLAMGLQAMAHDYALSRPLIDALYPDLLADDPQLLHTCQRLADWGCALVAFERERRRS
jgi:AcrR family transcriptional regulator